MKELHWIGTSLDDLRRFPTDARVEAGEGPAEAFRMPEVSGVAVVPVRAEGMKCARSWKISPLVGTDKEFPDVTPRDAAALREFYAARKAAE